MASKEKNPSWREGDGPNRVKRPRKVTFTDDVGLDPRDCITLHLVSFAEEMKGGTDVPSFSPDFLEHIFGVDRKIYGYKGLQIDVWIHALSFHVYIDVQYGEKVKDVEHGKQITDLWHILKDTFGTCLVEDRETFVQSLSMNCLKTSQMLHQQGDIVASWMDLQDGAGDQSIVRTAATSACIEKEILRLDLNDSGIRGWHSHLSPLIPMFIEAGRAIEHDDPRMDLYVTLQRGSLPNHENPWKLVGFCTVYRFYHYPDSTRFRISQILVLPPYQGKRDGLRLLEAVNLAAVQQDCYDVTVEDPSESLQELRDCMDAVRLLSFEPVRLALRIMIASLNLHKVSGTCNESSTQFSHTVGSKESNVVQLGVLKDKSWLQPSTDLLEMAIKNMKINKMQALRCWEVLLFIHLKDWEDHTQELFQELLIWRLKVELFGKSQNSKAGRGKLVVDTENEYGSSKTFLMMKMTHISRDHYRSMEEFQLLIQDTVEVDSKADHESILQELLLERLGEIKCVSEKVIVHCKSCGIDLCR